MALFNSIDSFHQHEHQTVVDSDASTKDESDVGEPQKYGDLNPKDCIHDISDYKRYVQGFLRYTSRRAASRSNLNQEASKVNNQMENIMVFVIGDWDIEFWKGRCYKTKQFKNYYKLIFIQ